ncbi:retrotransposon-like protein [Cucumis melo var. makuwa]|uniref:Retrotransposon-like protein n=1 Tax=Cucumis melo var. makuwa TaxID=1194695 RepID=A0A5D3DGI2_CUCMM|nr:retrotransposon-like protein [Cucumis melo var. makuwa]
MFSDEENYCESNDEEVGMTLISISTINKEEVERVHPGCSRHMTGNASFFSELNECNVGSIVFGDEGKGRIIGKGTIDHPRLPYLLDVRLVQGLSANLTSIIQLCD